MSDKPTIAISYYDSGEKYSEVYMINEDPHREDGPAYTAWHKNGDIYKEEYYYHGMLHRLDGPASIYYSSKYNRLAHSYHINDRLIECNSDEEFKKIVKLMMFK